MSRDIFSPFYTYPDSLTGAIAAVESIKGGVSILNSPTGCKFSPSFLVDKQDPGNQGVDPSEYQEEFFFGQPRVPCTYLDEIDFIHGSEEKLDRLLKVIEKKGYDIAAIINGPGTALIGDDLEGIIRNSGVKIPVLTVEATSFNAQASEGHNQVWLQILDKNNVESNEETELLITGSNLLSLRCMDDIHQLKDELALGGIKNIVNIGPGADLKELGKIKNSNLIVSINEPYGNKIAAHISGKYQTKTPDNMLLAPVGLQASEKWLSSVVKELNGDLVSLKNYFIEARQKLHRVISRFHSRMALPEGLTCFINADSAIAAPLMLYLYDYLGISPIAVSLLERAQNAENFIDLFIKERNLNTKVLTNLNQFDESKLLTTLQPDIIFGSAHDYSIAYKTFGKKVPYVSVAFPDIGKIYITRQPLMGIGGTLVLTENILNAIIPLSRTALL